MQKTRMKISLNTPCTPLNSTALWVLLSTASLTLSPFAYAVGLGNYQVRSALGQPLKVAFDVVNVSKGNVAASCFAVAKESSGTSEGIPYVTQGSLRIEGKGKSSKVVFTSSKSTNDPIVKLALETTCGQRSKREYTIMLDPQRTTDGKEIPLPLAPGIKASSAPSSPSAASETGHSATKFTPIAVPAKNTHQAVSSEKPVSSPKENLTPAVDASHLPGGLTPSELEAFERAIHKDPKKEKKKVIRHHRRGGE